MFNMPITMQPPATIHATGLLVGHRGILVRGPSGSGKSQLALALLQSAGFTRLVGDDRIQLEAVHGRLLMRAVPVLQGLIEIRGLGLRSLPFEPVAVAHLVVDLAADDAARLPEPESTSLAIEGIPLARLPVAPGQDALPALLGFLRYGDPRRSLPAA